MTYAAGSVKSMVDYITVQQEDKAKVRTIPNEEKEGIRSSNRECMYGSSRKKRREEYMVRDKVEEAEWKYLDVNDH